MPRDRRRNRREDRSPDDIREQLADDLGIPADQIGVQERRDSVETRLREDGRQELREDLAGEDEFVEPGDIGIDDDGLGIDAGITDDGRRRATTRRFEDSVGVDIEPDEVVLDDDGVSLEDPAQQRVDSARIDALRSDLPSGDDIFFPVDSSEARNVSAALGRELESGDIGALSDVSAAAGRRTGDIDVGVIEDLDPDFAEELSRIDAEDVEQAQQDIQERRELLDEDPSAFFEPIAEDTDRFLEDATRLDRRQEIGRGRRREARQQVDEIESDIVSDSDLLGEDDLDIRPDLAAGTFDVGLTDDGRRRIEDDVIDDIQTDTDFEAEIPRSAVDVRQTDDGFDVDLDDGFQRDLARQELAEDVGADPSDIVVEQDGDDITATLSEDFLEDRRRDEEDEVRGGLIEDLDEQFPGVDITADDVDFEVDGDEVTAELTDDAIRDIERQASLLSDFEIDTTQFGVGTGPDPSSGFVGSETAQMPLEDPLADTQPQGLAVGDTQLVGPGEDFPDGIGDISDLEFGRDEILSTDLPTSLRETAPIVRETSRDVASIPAERVGGAAVQRSLEAQQVLDGDIDEIVDSPTGQTAVAAGAAGIAAPEPTTTIGGAAVAGGAIAGAGAIELAQRGEIDIDPQEVDQDQSELTVEDASIGQSELETSETRRRAEIEAPTTTDPTAAEIETPSTGEVFDGTELGVPTVEAQQAGFAGQQRVVEDLDELLDEEEIERIEREERSELARQGLEQTLFEQQREFGEIERETIPERDRFEPIEIDDIGEGIAGRGEPETFGERDELFGERFQRLIEEDQQEQQRFFEQEESVVTTRPEQVEAEQQTDSFADAGIVGSFEAPAAPDFSPAPAAAGVDEFQDIAGGERPDVGFDQPAQFDTPQAEPTAVAADPMAGLNEAAMQAETALQETALPTEQVTDTATQDAFAEPTLTETLTQPSHQGREGRPFQRPELPDFDTDFAADDGIEEFDILDDRTVRELDDPDFLGAGIDDDLDDLPDPLEGL